ncbi:N-acetyltransferase family protein [Micromonospora sp. MS34]|uniref:GNAT family N-acetyltransferase n=1 Tax=Micromonospora sp. MS34 TaxID=3385971 RepID=UPI00399F1BE9
MLVVREATLADLDGVVDIHHRARIAYYGAGGVPVGSVEAASQDLRARWTRSLEAAEKRVRCAVADGEVVGIAAMGPPLAADVDAREVGQLYQIHVVPGRWRRGIGSRLHSAFLRYLAESSLRTGLLEVWERNRSAQAFYARHGWQPDGRRRPGGPDDTDYVYLRLEVAG